MHKIIEKIAFTKVRENIALIFALSPVMSSMLCFLNYAIQIHGMDAEQTEKTLNSGVIPQQLLLSAFSPEIKQGNAILPSCSFSLNTLPQVCLYFFLSPYACSVAITFLPPFR